MSKCFGLLQDKVPNFGHHYPYYKQSKIQTKKFYHGVIVPDDANEIGNSEDPDQIIRLLL